MNIMFNFMCFFIFPWPWAQAHAGLEPGLKPGPGPSRDPGPKHTKTLFENLSEQNIAFRTQSTLCIFPTRPAFGVLT